LRFGVFERTAQTPVFFCRQEPLARLSPVAAKSLAGVPPGREQLPGFGEGEHPREEMDRTVRQDRRIAKAVVKRGGFRSADFFQSHPAQGGQDVFVEHRAVRGDAGGLQMSLHVGAHETLGKAGHGGLRSGRRSADILAPLDAVDEVRGLFPGLITSQLTVAAERHALRPRWPPGLHHVGLTACSVDAHTEARQFPVPENRIFPVDLKRVDRALGEFQIASLRHPASSSM